jgi:hypothetical protein
VAVPSVCVRQPNRTDALELAVESDTDVHVTGIFVEVKERSGSPREVASPALLQLGELVQLKQKCLQTIEVLLRCVTPESIMKWV